MKSRRLRRLRSSTGEAPQPTPGRERKNPAFLSQSPQRAQPPETKGLFGPGSALGMQQTPPLAQSHGVGGDLQSSPQRAPPPPPGRAAEGKAPPRAGYIRRRDSPPRPRPAGGHSAAEGGPRTHECSGGGASLGRGSLPRGRRQSEGAHPTPSGGPWRPGKAHPPRPRPPRLPSARPPDSPRPPAQRGKAAPQALPDGDRTSSESGPEAEKGEKPEEETAASKTVNPRAARPESVDD
ncbi:proline-rich protein HaeIII subfamily 1-like [Eublepharis macularius]|uniref:Proline-rich protein HaeIII subfamily 1-like n=1 Tax=Eublepharis macularius TaxID=481883 RepID=A0AA97J229_EUBMA|nr:proline-rich protein HaeIII subfamily 1-like [Eublepharis macularius]